MKRNGSLLSKSIGLVIALALTGCAGTLTPEEEDELFRARGTATGGSPTGGPTTGGTGVDPAACVIALASGSKCSACHSENIHLAGFAFSMNTVPMAKTLWLDKPGQGDPPGSMMACGASDFANLKLINSAAPEMSLLYLKLTDPVPCGMHMPQVGYPIADSEKACILAWVKNVAGK
jgi:hypothetical protein